MTEKVTIEQNLTNQFMVAVNNIETNVVSGMFLTSEDKVKLCLESHVKDMEKRKEWLTPFGVFLTLIITLATASFNDVFGVNKYLIQAMFIMGGFVSGFYFLRSLLQRPKNITTDEIIAEIRGKKSSTDQKSLFDRVKKKLHW